MKKTKLCAKSLALLLTLALCLVCLSAPAFAAAEPDYTFGEAGYFSHISNGYNTAGFYYADDWFLADPAVRNDGLALISAKLAASAADAGHGEGFLEALGFSDLVSRHYGSAANDCAFVAGSKTIKKDGRDVTLMAVAFQGGEYGNKGWQQNVTVNVEGRDTEDHASYETAVGVFLDDLKELAPEGDVIYWFTGQSRAGAMANLAAAYLLDADKDAAVFCRTFEAPAVTQSSSAKYSKYAGIHNYIADDDPVTMIPMWGMARYGKDIVYNTASLDEVKKALAKLNPDALKHAEGYNAAPFGSSVKAYAKGLVNKLTAAVPSRDDYSKQNTVSIPGMGEIEFTYQESLQALCHIVFGGEEEDLTSLLMPMLGHLKGLVYAYAEEYYVAKKSPADSSELLADAAQRRWAAAVDLYTMTSAGCDTTFGTPALYGLLQLATPLVADGSKALNTYPEFPAFDDFDYSCCTDLEPLMNASTLVFSHQPDVIIARLSLLAPAPKMENIELEIEEPAAGDPAEKATSEAAQATAELGLPWLELSDARWLSDDTALEAGKIYYLQLSFRVPGHSIPDDLKILINDKKQYSLAVSYEDGAAIITSVWEFAVDEPVKVNVYFDNSGHGSAPRKLTLNKGTLFSLIEEPADQGDVRDDEGWWRFGGWYTEDGTPWAEASADGDMTFHAKWYRLIDEVRLTYSIPYVGDSGDSILDLRVPEGAPYRVEIYGLSDDEWNDVTCIENTREHTLSFSIYPASDDAILPFEELEDNEYEYQGALYINDEDMGPYPEYANIDIDGNKTIEFYVLYSFNPLGMPVPDDAGDDGGDYPDIAPDSGAGGRPDSGSGNGSGSSGKPGEDPVFRDVPADAWFAESVAWAVKSGVTEGTGDGVFSPDASCTRAQMVTFLWRAAGKPAAAAEMPFVDVPEGAWYAEAVSWAVSEGITKGVDAEHFAPDKVLSRAECVTFLFRMTAESPADAAACAFSDVPADAWYYDAVCWAAANDVVKGKTADLFAPQDDCSRAEIVTMLFRLLVK